MGLSTPCTDSLDIIDLQTVKKLLDINPMGLSPPWADSLDILALYPVNKNCQGLTQCDEVLLGPNLLILLTCIQ